MKKTSISKSPKRVIDDARPEYKLDYRKARPNRFAGRNPDERVVVVLDADVAEVFTTPEAVNHALRALITAMPPAKKKTTAR